MTLLVHYSASTSALRWWLTQVKQLFAARGTSGETELAMLPPISWHLRCRRHSWATALGTAGVLGTMVASMVVSSEGAAGRTLERLGPKGDLAVFWVGHSLIESSVKSEWGDHNIMSMVGRFAEARGLQYRMGDHTLWGSPISALWRGSPHSYKRDASAMVAKRETFERDASQYDTLVLTEALPIRLIVRNEYGAYYLRRFYCTLLQANPAARVYLYQTWVNLQGVDPHAKLPPPHLFDWRAEMVAQRKVWEDLALSAARPGVRAPGWLDRFGWTSTSDAGCATTTPIFIVPAGQALVALWDRLARPAPNDGLRWPDGRRFTMADHFRNAYVDWPADWPMRGDSRDVDYKAIIQGLKLKDSKQAHDDIHLSAVGIYFIALVHFATLYRQSPVGLPAPASIGEGLARAFQCIVWTVVASDPSAGVAGEGNC
jgi:hypothetical protein